LLFISKFHVGAFKPTILTQAGIRLACDMVSALAGLIYFIYIAKKLQRKIEGSEEQVRSQIIKPKVLAILARPAVYTFAESVIRNSIYLWIVSKIIALGQDYATAWGVFNTIRWGLIMVPVQALEASTLTFVGHYWARWRAQVGVNRRKPTATWKDIKCLLPQCRKRLPNVASLMSLQSNHPSSHCLVRNRPRHRGSCLHIPFLMGYGRVCLLYL